MIRRRATEQCPFKIEEVDAEKGEARPPACPGGTKVAPACPGGTKVAWSLKQLVGPFGALLVIIALRTIATVVTLDILYVTYDAMTFGDPCKIAEDVRLKFATSTRQGMNTKPSPLPKIIHQQWKTEEIPAGLFTKVHAEWKRLYPEPEYKHMLWTDDSARKLIENRFPWFLEVFDNYGLNIQRADSARYFILYAYGGLYADLDYEPFVNFWGDLPNDRVSFIESPYKMNENVQNSLMSSPVRDPFWNATFDLLYERRNIADILASTGPAAVTEAIRRTPDPSWVHVLQCQNFHRIPAGTEEKNKALIIRMGQKIREYTPMVKTCGNYAQRDNCQFGMHHNAVSYSSDLNTTFLPF